jgi:hypothetical protein
LNHPNLGGGTLFSKRLDAGVMLLGGYCPNGWGWVVGGYTVSYAAKYLPNGWAWVLALRPNRSCGNPVELFAQ